MSREWLFDTNVFLRYQEEFGRLRGGTLVLCSVVVQELLVHVDPEKRAGFDRLLKRVPAGLILTPGHEDWVAVGNRLRRLLTSYPQAGNRLSKPEVNLLVRDGLITQCAIARNRSHRVAGKPVECIIVTDNIRDFEKVTHGTHQKFFSSQKVFGI
jgi:predicted nucleic acid-binding protein